MVASLCATVVWHGFVVTPETNCIIVVVGTGELDGSKVEVSPKVAADPDRAQLTATLRQDNQYSARFFLSSGTYQVRLARPDGSMVMDVTDFVPPGRHWSYDLTHLKLPATAPASLR